jgi:NADH dehydrogenase
VGSHALPALVATGEPVRCAVRTRRAARLVAERGATPILCDVRDGESVFRASRDIRVVVDLVTITEELRRGDFEAVHLRGAMNVVAAAEHHGIRRVVRDCVRERIDDHVVLETSIVFGPGDQLLSGVALALRYLPFLPIPGRVAANTLFQPVSVSDVVRCIVRAAAEPSIRSGVHPLGGPDVFRFVDLVRMIDGELLRHRRVVMVPTWPVRALLRLTHRIAPRWHVPPAFLELVGVDSVCDSRATYELFGLTPMRLPQHLSYLGDVKLHHLWRPHGIVPA